MDRPRLRRGNGGAVPDGRRRHGAVRAAKGQAETLRRDPGRRDRRAVHGRPIGADGHQLLGIYMDGHLSGKTVYGNLIVSIEGKIGEITEPARIYSNISNNATYRQSALKKLFADPAGGDYTLRDDAPVFDEIPDFVQLPLNEIGRY